MCRKRRRIRPDSAIRHRAEYPNHVWAIDFQFDETADWRRLKIANIVDEYTREALAMEVDRSITADKLIDVIERLVVTHGLPSTCAWTTDPSCCRGPFGTGADSPAPGPIYIEPGSPWENPFVE